MLKTGVQLAEYESNRCPTDVLALLMKNEAVSAKNCLICPERNSIGVAVINELKHLDYWEIYRERVVDKVTEQIITKFGWHTNSKTKPLMLFELKRDFEAGLIEINSKPLLREMRSLTNGDVTYSNFDPEASNHFDRVIAMAIGWQMRNAVQSFDFV